MCLALASFSVNAQANSNQSTDLRNLAQKYDAQPGASLASAPKIRADGKIYYLYGKIEQAKDGESFLLARLSESPAEHLSRKLMGYPSPESTDYFGIIIPEEMQDYYYQNAKIDGGFSVIGQYQSNIDYKTVLGQNKNAPVFKALWFEMWSSPHPKPNDSADGRGSAEYEQCVRNAGVVMFDMIECSSHELERQDKRLNENYKAAMARSSDKKSLRSKQRQWIKDRDATCKFDPDGGSAARLEHSECLWQFTAKRADELKEL